MAFQSQDGKKKFGSAYVAKRYDSAHPKEDMKDMGAAKDEKVTKMPPHKDMHMVEEPKESKAESMAEGEKEMNPVVQEHGPAHEVHIMHDHENHKHTVTSKHKDGHTNMSEHETPEEAHEVGGSLANISLKKSGEAGDEQGAASEGDNENTPDGFVMPDLA